MPYPGYGPRGPRGNRESDPSNNPEHEQFRKLFIGGLSYDTDEASLRQHFGQYGEITDCVVMKDTQTKKSRGFGFITFKATDQLEAVQSSRPHKVDGREVETKRAMPREDVMNQQSVDKMFVGGLKDDTTEEMIREAFSGKIRQVEMITDKATGKSRGFCFVTFYDQDTVDKHVLKKYFEINGRRVEVKKAMSKTDMGYLGRGGYNRGDFGPFPAYGMGGGPGGSGGYGGFPPNRGGYGGGNYGNQGGYGSGGYGNQGWNQGGYGDYGYNNQGGWGGPNYNYSGPMKGGAGGYGGGGFGGGSNYNRR